ncbi:1-deoxy-D-xylulose-5-phosphate synthase [Spirochaetia bacterium]|nr:1-deoxy-D-xylulose-5-phosphate synthase [Spirochaetia bacterium]
MNLPELNRLAAEIRGIIVSTVSRNGGHLASNLGVVELTIALHRVFNSPKDKIVWDVGHQCYAHKLLTGRFEAFSGLRRMGGIAGFPKGSESPHDAFNTGHASTSISAALGLLAGDRILGGDSMAVALIGDGALTGGPAYEGLSHAGQLGLPLVVILNDNKMSISPNVGGLSKYLSRLSMKARYQSFRRKFDAMAKKLPYVGDVFFEAVVRMKRAVKAVFYTDNFFVDLGFEYVGPIDGHNLPTLIQVFEDVRKLGRPVVIHVITRKGKGYGYAEDDPGSYHGVGSFSVAGGLKAGQPPAVSGGNPSTEESGPTFTEAFGTAILEAARGDARVAAITAAMEKGTGLSPFKKAFPLRFFDVGIAEGHALIFAAGLAARFLKPVAAIYSTFIQRSIDQVIHDVSLQNLPVILALDRSGFVGEDGETHQGLFDIALFRPIPNMTILAPAGESELRLMLNWALEQGAKPALGSPQGDSAPPACGAGSGLGPIAIRYPKGRCPGEIPEFSQALEKGRGVWLNNSGLNGAVVPNGATASSSSKAEQPVCLAFTGGLYREVRSAAERLGACGIGADLYNLRFLKPIDEDYLADIMNRYQLTVFIEEGIRAGGFGEYAAELALRRFCAGKVLVLAVPEHFVSLGTRAELIRMNGLDGEGIAAGVLKVLR